MRSNDRSSRDRRPMGTAGSGSVPRRAARRLIGPRRGAVVSRKSPRVRPLGGLNCRSFSAGTREGTRSHYSEKVSRSVGALFR